MDTTNSFPQIVEIAVQLPPIEPSLDEPTSDEIDDYLAAHAGSLTITRALLQQPCRNPVPADRQAWQSAFEKIGSVRELARIFERSSQSLQRRGDLGGAVDEAKNCLLLALAVRKHGLMTEYLVSIAIEGTGLSRLGELRHELPPERRSALISFLENHETAREPYDDIADRDDRWEAEMGSETPCEPSNNEWSELGFDEHTSQAFNALMAELQAESESMESRTPEEIAAERRENFRDADHRILSQQRLLRIELALLVWRSEHDAYPHQIHWLEPGYLSVVPIDPNCGQQYRYRRDGDAFVLYGLNSLGVDLGGIRGGRYRVTDGQADFFLDSNYDDLELANIEQSEIDDRITKFFREHFPENEESP